MDSVTVAFELMRLELEAEVEALNAEGARLYHQSLYDEAQKLAEKGKRLKTYCDKVRALEIEWQNGLSKIDYQVRKPLPVSEAAKKIISASKSSKTGLLVRFPDGTVIAEKNAADTLAKAIQKFGFERVGALGVMVNGENIVSKNPSPKYNETPIPPFYVKIHSSTQQKKRNIEQIASELNIKN